MKRVVANCRSRYCAMAMHAAARCIIMSATANLKQIEYGEKSPARADGLRRDAKTRQGIGFAGGS